ncbi:DUF3347 domain-containing protein [Reichenbachiella ulvae]|uniref:DUF3347 domain-containing protein n=1 Tax=Reichenbachiella ulvae TaxID=2980104 RepID=A0ABT3CQ92_9BACT|nr:DUF3347 domain-containing protein [Reichenbachiella ulvae]MCV9385787.1 DUF3347 domain-containing protein [Reichenbachiella ulvae]
MKNLALIPLLFVLIACQSKKNETEKSYMVENTELSAAKTEKEDLKFKSTGIQTIYSAYASLRDALVETDFETAKKYAQQLSIALESESKMQEAGIASNIFSAGEIEIARRHFYELNEGMEAILEGNIESGKINKCYCPMALDNKGASWFSTKDEINNPYFGDKMLKCGVIKKTLE